MAAMSFLDMHTSPMQIIIDLLEVLAMRLTHRMRVALVWYGKKTGKTTDEIWSGLRMQTALELPADSQDWDLITYERILTKIGSDPAMGKTFIYDPLESNRDCLAPRLEDQPKVDASDEASFVVVGSTEPPTVDYLCCLSVYEKARDAFLSARLGSYNWFMAFMAMAEAGVLLEHFKNAQDSYGYSISKLRRAMLWELSEDDDDDDDDNKHLLSGFLNKNFGWEMEMCDHGIEDELPFKPRSRATAGPCWNYKMMTWEPRIASPQADDDLPRPIVLPYVHLCYNAVESVLDQREEYMQMFSIPFGKMVVDLSGAWMLKTLDFLQEDMEKKHEEHRESLENMEEWVMFDDYDRDHIKTLRSRFNKGV
ncbi:hypothetical protein SELMODRAFT_407163 [Selaginella moellendorffii]|uniref:Uncharacterized protein n=1 Tax=Selaginella moellendorffii TaxID=88036 RepID=D8R441_SELML|nr:hypothetical protein SELMODRAFT_407163 [Selaginella moellendorffii]